MKPIDLRTTALVLIDLQQGIVSREAAPHSPADVVSRAAQLAEFFRARQALVVLVRVAFSADDRDRLKVIADQPAPAVASLPSGYSDIVEGLGPHEGDVLITKRQWGAFYGTELELQLRRRGIRTLVMAGIATNFGVESTARDAWERGYEQYFAEDAMSGLTEAAHAFSVSTILPRLGHVLTTAELLDLLDH